MKNEKEHLDINLEFLDKKETFHPTSKQERDNGNEPYKTPSNNSRPNSKKPRNWKNILIIGGIVLFVVSALSSDNSNTSSSTANNTTDTQGSSDVIRGDYRCSSYDAGQADALEPSLNETLLTSDQTALGQRSNYLDNLKTNIDNSYVNEYSSQYEIDDYNQSVDNYNNSLASYKRDVANLESRIDSFNAQVEAHNNYLINNCTKAY